MADKTQWPESDHGFFMHPPLLKATAGRPKTERYKGCSEKKRKSRKHLCPICKDYGHHWHNCKNGNPDDIVAMMTVRGPPKKRLKITKSTESAIVPCVDGAPTMMCFPPSLESATSAEATKRLENLIAKREKKCNSGSGESKRTRTGSSQPAPITIELPMPSEKKQMYM